MKIIKNTACLFMSLTISMNALAQNKTSTPLNIPPELKEMQEAWQKDNLDSRNPLNNTFQTIYIKYHYIGDKEPPETGVLREMYRNGYKYIKHTFLTPIQGQWFKVMQLSSQPDSWYVGLDAKKGIHVKDKNGGHAIHIEYCPPNQHIFMEFGQELYYFKKHNALQVPVKDTTDNTDAYQLINTSYTMTLYVNKKTNLPLKIDFKTHTLNDHFGNFAIIYDDYKIDMPFDKNNYQLPDNIELVEGDENTKLGF